MRASWVCGGAQYRRYSGTYLIAPIFILLICLFIFCLPQKRPRAGAVLDFCAASAGCDRTGVPLICADEGRSRGETDDAGQAYADGEPGRGGGDADGDRVRGKPSDSRQGAI